MKYSLIYADPAWEYGNTVSNGAATNQTNYAFNQSRFTAKGVRWIGGLWAEHIAKGQIA